MYLVVLGTQESGWSAAVEAYLTVDTPTSLPTKSIYFNLDTYDPEGDSRYQVDNLAVELFVKKVFENISTVEVNVSGVTHASTYDRIKFVTPAESTWYDVVPTTWQRLIHVTSMNTL